MKKGVPHDTTRRVTHGMHSAKWKMMCQVPMTWNNDILTLGRTYTYLIIELVVTWKFMAGHCGNDVDQSGQLGE